MGTIYILENKINGKCYVGQTTQEFSKRFRQHNQSHSLIGNAIRKYGVDKFNKILVENILEDKLDDLEKEYIQKYNSAYPNGYNLDGGGSKEKHRSPETKEKIRKTNIEKGLRPPSNIGRHLTEDHKRKIGESGKGRHNYNHSNETREAISEKLKGNKNAYGKRKTEEQKKKISESGKGRHQTEETKRMLSIINKGVNNPFYGGHHTQEWKKNHGEMMTGSKNPFFGKRLTEEHKRKISEGMQKGK